MRNHVKNKVKKQLMSVAILLASSISGVYMSGAYAGEVPNVDVSRDLFINNIQGRWQPTAGAVSNEKPDVNHSSSQFVSYIQNGGHRDTNAVSNDKPDTERSVALFANSIFN